MGKVIFFSLLVLIISLSVKYCNDKRNAEYTEDSRHNIIRENELNIINGKDFRTDAKNFNGSDWLLMNDKQKMTVVQNIILRMRYVKKSTQLEISQDEVMYYIDGLNSFYGTEKTNSTDIISAMVLLETYKLAH